MHIVARAQLRQRYICSSRCIRSRTVQSVYRATTQSVQSKQQLQLRRKASRRAHEVSKRRKIDNLTTPLPIPVGRKLTRSEAFCLMSTNIDPCALRIENLPGDNNSHKSLEYLLFMDTRLELQWASYRMTPQSWTTATHVFNTKLVVKYAQFGLGTPIKKNPRAIMDKLESVKQQVLQRIRTTSGKPLSSARTRGNMLGAVVPPEGEIGSARQAPALPRAS